MLLWKGIKYECYKSSYRYEVKGFSMVVKL